MSSRPPTPLGSAVLTHDEGGSSPLEPPAGPGRPSSLSPIGHERSQSPENRQGSQNFQWQEPYACQQARRRIQDDLDLRYSQTRIGGYLQSTRRQSSGQQHIEQPRFGLTRSFGPNTQLSSIPRDHLPVHSTTAPSAAPSQQEPSGTAWLTRILSWILRRRSYDEESGPGQDAGQDAGRYGSQRTMAGETRFVGGPSPTAPIVQHLAGTGVGPTRPGAMPENHSSPAFAQLSHLLQPNTRPGSLDRPQSSEQVQISVSTPSSRHPAQMPGSHSGSNRPASIPDPRDYARYNNPQGCLRPVFDLFSGHFDARGQCDHEYDPSEPHATQVRKAVECGFLKAVSDSNCTQSLLYEIKIPDEFKSQWGDYWVLRDYQTAAIHLTNATKTRLAHQKAQPEIARGHEPNLSLAERERNALAREEGYELIDHVERLRGERDDLIKQSDAHRELYMGWEKEGSRKTTGYPEIAEEKRAILDLQVKDSLIDRPSHSTPEEDNVPSGNSLYRRSKSKDRRDTNAEGGSKEVAASPMPVTLQAAPSQHSTAMPEATPPSSTPPRTPTTFHPTDLQLLEKLLRETVADAGPIDDDTISALNDHFSSASFREKIKPFTEMMRRESAVSSDVKLVVRFPEAVVTLERSNPDPERLHSPSYFEEFDEYSALSTQEKPPSPSECEHLDEAPATTDAPTLVGAVVSTELEAPVEIPATTDAPVPSDVPSPTQFASRNSFGALKNEECSS